MRAAYHGERFVWELIAPGSSDPSKSLHKLKWLFRRGHLIYCKRKGILNFNIYVKKPLEYHQCLIFELSCFHEWNVIAFVMSDYYKNRLLMDEHPKGCSSPSSAPIEYKLVLVSRVEGIAFHTHYKCWTVSRQSLFKQLIYWMPDKCCHHFICFCPVPLIGCCSSTAKNKFICF